jgi:hypothetical protein
MNTTLTITSRQIGADENLHNYALRPDTISRKTLNIMAGIGTIIFGWLIVIALGRLNRRAIGWALLIPCMIANQVTWRATDPGLQALGGLVTFGLYVTLWVLGNRTLTGYERGAHARIAEIDGLVSPGADDLMEKGILQYRVLKQEQPALSTLRQALAMAGGDPALLTVAAKVMKEAGRKQEALDFEHRAAGELVAA